MPEPRNYRPLLRGSSFFVVASNAIIALVCVCALPSVAEGTPKTKLKEKFIAEEYDFSGIKRVAIYPICAKPNLKKQSQPGLSRRPQVDMPSDSVLVSLVDELISRTKYLDSTIEAVVLDNPDPKLHDRKLIAMADSASHADAVILARVTSLYGERATPVVHSGYEPVRGSFPPLGGAPASTTVRVNFSMFEVKSGKLIWEIDVQAKESGGGTKYSGSEADPPLPEPIIRGLVITAASWLPF